MRIWPFKIQHGRDGENKSSAPEVGLVMYDDRIKIASAKQVQAGWMAKWGQSDDTWQVLNLSLIHI